MIDSDKVTNNSGDVYYCSMEPCKNGMFTPRVCQKYDCAVLFASYASKFLFIYHITFMNMPITVQFITQAVLPIFCSMVGITS